MSKTVSVALALALVSLSRLAWSDEPTSAGVEDLDLLKLLNVQVSTATKTSESLEEAPAVITVVTRTEMERWGYQTVAEVLQHTVGFYLVDDHILPNAGVRGVNGGLGAESGVIKVMIDGRSVAYRTTSGNWLGVELVPLSSVAQIEIIRGPASALYGADAFLGVVNIITVQPGRMRPFTARTSLGLTEGNPGARFDVASGFTLGKFDLLLGAAGEQSDRSGLSLPAESPDPVLPADVGARRTALDLKRRSLALQARLGYRDAEVGHLVLSANASAFRRGGDFARYAQLTNSDDGQSGTQVSLGQLRLSLDALAHASDELDLSLQTTYFQGGVAPADRVEVASDLFYVERDESYRGVDAVAEARWMPSGHFNLIAGIESVYDREQFSTPERINRATRETVLSAGDFDRTIHLVNLGVYLSSNVKVIDDWLKLTGGVRFDHHSEYGDQISGRVGLTSRWSRAIMAKLLYGNAFKAPSPSLSYAAPLRPGDIVGNPNLRPQYIHTFEYQISYTPSRFFGVTSGLSYSLLQDKAEFTPQGINLTARNLAKQKSLSWESRVDLQHYDDYTTYASFELVHSVRELGQEGYAAELVGTQNVVYPPYIARAGASVAVPAPPEFPLNLGAVGMLVGPRRAADASIVQRGSSFSHPPYFMLDTFISSGDLYWIAGHESRIALRSKNLLLARGPDPGFSGFEYPLTPAELFLELRHTY